MRVSVRDLAACEKDAAINRPVQPHERAHECRLARPVCPEQRDEFSLTDGQRHVFEHRCRAVTRGQPLHRERFGAACLARHAPGQHLEISFAQIRTADRRVPLDLGRRALGDHAPGIEHVDGIRNPHDQLHVVLDDQHAYIQGRDTAQHRAEPVGVPRRQSRGRFVEQDDLGPCGERARDLDQAPVDVRQFARRALSRSSIADPGEECIGQGDRVRGRKRDPPRERPAVQSDEQVLAHAHAGEELRRLESAGDTGPCGSVR